MAAGDTRYEYAIAAATSDTSSSASRALDAVGTNALQAMVNSLRAALPTARVISAQRWQTSGYPLLPSRVHLVIVGPDSVLGVQAAVRAALPAAVNSAVRDGTITLSPNVVASAYEGPMGGPGAGWSQVATATSGAPSSGGTTPAPTTYDRCNTGSAVSAFRAYRDEWGPLSGSNEVTVPALTVVRYIGRARRTISGPSDNRLLQIELRTGPMAGQKVWAVSDPGNTASLRNNGCAAVDTFAPDARPNPNTSPTAGGSTSNPTPAPPPAPLPPVQPAQASAAGGDLAMWVVVMSLAGAGYLVYDKMKRRRR